MRCEITEELKADARKFEESRPNEFECDCCPVTTPDGPLHEPDCNLHNATD
jgi:hypothetical protein